MGKVKKLLNYLFVKRFIYDPKSLKSSGINRWLADGRKIFQWQKLPAGFIWWEGK